MSSEKQKNQRPLSRRENQIMDILFSKGECNVVEITKAMPDELSRNAVRTFLTILEGKKYITRRKSGREYFYTAIPDKDKAGDSAFAKVLDVFFNGSISTAMAAQFTNGKQIKDEELDKLQSLIKKARNNKK